MTHHSAPCTIAPAACATVRTALLMLPATASYDQAACAWALGHFLHHTGASVTIVFPTTAPPLPTIVAPPTPPGRIVTAVPPLHGFAMRIARPDAVAAATVRTEDAATTITIVPRDGALDPRAISFAPAAPLYDAVFFCGTTPAAALPDDEQRAALADVPQTICAYDRMTHAHAQAWRATALPAASATALLAGILADTAILRHADAATFALAADLLRRGADLHTIIYHLHDRASFAQLRAIGAALATLRCSADGAACMMTVPAGTSPERARMILRRLAPYFPHTRCIALIAPDANAAILAGPDAATVGRRIGCTAHPDRDHLITCTTTPVNITALATVLGV